MGPPQGWKHGSVKLPLGREPVSVLPRPDVGAINPRPDAAVSGFELRAGLNRAAADEDGEDLLRVFLRPQLEASGTNSTRIPVALSEAPRVEPVPESSMQGRRIPDGRKNPGVQRTRRHSVALRSTSSSFCVRPRGRAGARNRPSSPPSTARFAASWRNSAFQSTSSAAVPLHDLAAYLDRVEVARRRAGRRELRARPHQYGDRAHPPRSSTWPRE